MKSTALHPNYLVSIIKYNISKSYPSIEKKNIVYVTDLMRVDWFFQAWSTTFFYTRTFWIFLFSMIIRVLYAYGTKYNAAVNWSGMNRISPSYRRLLHAALSWTLVPSILRHDVTTCAWPWGLYY